MKNGNLYFAQVDGGGVIKIGSTAGCVTQRVKQLQWASPCILHWIGACRAPRSEEKETHRRLAEYRFRNEWFHPVNPVLEHIRSRVGDFNAEAYVERHFRRGLYKRYAEFAAYKPKLQDQILEEAGIGRYWVAKWRELRAPLPQEAYQSLEVALDKFGAPAEVV